MNAHFQAPALQRRLSDIVAEYEEKAGAIPANLETFREATTALESAACVGGAFGGAIWSHGRYASAPSVAERDMRTALLKSAWRHVYAGLNIGKIASAEDRRKFDMALENPPEFTLDNIAATFGTYVQEPRFHILKGLAECFCQLDPAYKSHQKVKIGVEGLPKRIILSSVADWGSWGYDRLRDTLNALNVYRGEPHITEPEISSILSDAKEHGAAYYQGIELRRFKNGNAHLIFDPETLREINLALAEFYGDVLPDSPEEAPKRRTGTAVSKDLAFYATPAAVADRVVASLHLQRGAAILEPSCGDGRLIDAILRSDQSARVTGCEYDAERAQECRAKGYHVHRANFLETAPNPVFDAVIMNPPFAGKHWRKHLDHARKFLKPRDPETGRGGGSLVCILPASAFYDGHLSDLIGADRYNQAWEDLPTASFAESGTNVPTGFVILGPA